MITLPPPPPESFDRSMDSSLVPEFTDEDLSVVRDESYSCDSVNLYNADGSCSSFECGTAHCTAHVCGDHKCNSFSCGEFDDNTEANPCDENQEVP